MQCKWIDILIGIYYHLIWIDRKGPEMLETASSDWVIFYASYFAYLIEFRALLGYHTSAFALFSFCLCSVTTPYPTQNLPQVV